ncbi:MAG: M23 family metallopeptidase [Limisphaerales bacterium]
MTFSFVRQIIFIALFSFSCAGVFAQSPFQFPTANRALYQIGSELKFFASTGPDKPWTSGSFGCVRNDGTRMHEGLDIRCLQRDKHGEPTDPVMATADGTVMYINAKPSLSNYGNYIVLRHVIEGIEIYSLYAHLREIRAGLKVGQNVKAGQNIATLGRTSNTSEAIAKDRAHCHFELDLLINDRFQMWFNKNSPGTRNDHGVWNGQNMLGFDPREILIAERHPTKKFSLLNYIRSQTELCRVLVRSTNFSFLKRYPALVYSNSKATKEGIAGYEIVLNYNGVPFALMPRVASEIKSPARIQLLSVNAKEYRANPCRKLVAQSGGRWQLTAAGLRTLDLLTYYRSAL